MILRGGSNVLNFEIKNYMNVTYKKRGLGQSTTRILHLRSGQTLHISHRQKERRKTFPTIMKVIPDPSLSEFKTIPRRKIPVLTVSGLDFPFYFDEDKILETLSFRPQKDDIFVVSFQN